MCKIRDYIINAREFDTRKTDAAIDNDDSFFIFIGF